MDSGIRASRHTVASSASARGWPALEWLALLSLLVWFALVALIVLARQGAR